MNTIGTGLDLSSLGLTAPKDTKKAQLGQDAFLSLMMTQLKNQDPFKPLESGAFLGQIAQFGTVSGLQDLQTKFDSLSSALVSNQALQAASLVGHSALVESSKAALFPGGVVDAAVDVPSATSGVQVEVRDASGRVVRHLELGASGTGLARFEWDGLADDGTQAPPGAYQLVGSFLSGTKAAAAPTLVYAPVDSVVLGTDGFTVDVRGIGELPFSKVRQIGY